MKIHLKTNVEITLPSMCLNSKLTNTGEKKSVLLKEMIAEERLLRKLWQQTRLKELRKNQQTNEQ